MSQNKHSGTSGYAHEAPALLKQYEALDSATIHRPVRQLFLPAGASLIDIGAGTGRDAAWFAANGYTVTAVEPTNELRTGAQQLHAEHSIQWIDDELPGLDLVKKLDRSWDMLMLTAVWMHLNTKDRHIAMGTLAALTHAGSRVYMTLRHGEVPDGRVMYDVSGEETTALATQHGFKTLLCETRDSRHIDFRGAGIRWTNVVLER